MLAGPRRRAHHKHGSSLGGHPELSIDGSAHCDATLALSNLEAATVANRDGDVLHEPSAARGALRAENRKTMDAKEETKKKTQDEKKAR